jgi:xanthine dehydrogenase accessory factor
MKLSTLQALREARRAGRPVVLATWLASAEGKQQLFAAPGDEDDPIVNPPPPPPRSAGDDDPIIIPPPRPPKHDGDERGIIPPPPAKLEEAVARALRSDAAEVVQTEEGEVLLEPQNPPLRMVLVGAVHIAHPLAEMAKLAGFAVTIVDPRRSFATAERFPGQALVVAWPDEALRELALDARTAVVTLTHDPKLDDPALEVALRSPAFYVGSLGSKKTHATRVTRLRDAGFDEATIGRIRGPVGLPIGARSPAEIAVSILAQIIGALRSPS